MIETKTREPLFASSMTSRLRTSPSPPCDREIACPPFDPDEVLVGGDSPVDQHHGHRTCAVFFDEPSPKIEQHRGEILIENAFSAEPVEKERVVLEAHHHTFRFALATALAGVPPRHCPRHRRAACGHHSRS
jgi:hypothetical protein